MATSNPHASLDWSIFMRDILYRTSLTYFLRAHIPTLALPHYPQDEHDEHPGHHPALIIVHSDFVPTDQLPRLIGREARKQRRVVFLHGHVPQETEHAARLAGSQQLVADTGSRTEIIEAIHRALKSPAPGEVASGVSWTQASERTTQYLTQAEERVLDALFRSEDITLADIASELGISINTVRNHLANVRKRVGDGSGRNRHSLQHELERRGWYSRFSG